MLVSLSKPRCICNPQEGVRALLKTSFMLCFAGNLVATLNVSADEVKFSTDFSQRVSEKPMFPSAINEQNPAIATPAAIDSPLQPYFDAGCALHGIDDYYKNESWFFCIDDSGFNFTFIIEGGDYEGLDYNGSFLFASAGDDASFPEVKGDILKIESYPSCQAIPTAHLGTVRGGQRNMKEVDGIAFDKNGNMVGWAQEAGLFWVPAANLVSPIEGQLVLEQPGEVEDLEIVTLPNGEQCVVGLLNIDHLGQAKDGDGEPHPNHLKKPTDVNAIVNVDGVVKANYMMACPTINNAGDMTWALSVPCEQEMTESLREYKVAEIEAIEILPKLPSDSDEELKVLLGFHANNDFGPGNAKPPPGNSNANTFVLGVLEVASCTLKFQDIEEIQNNINESENLDVEGLAMVCQ